MNFKNRVLVVDDEPGVRKLLLKVLSEFQVRTVDNVEKAVEIINRSACDVVVSDIKMPGHSGLELLNIAKHLIPQIPVIMITGHGNKQNAIESIKGGAYDYLEKPFEDEEIIYAVRRALEKRKMELEKKELVFDLKEKNAELETLNEEIQSTNEELETTNEELSLSNEELRATEEEMRQKQEENDMRIKELFIEIEKLKKLKN